MSHECKRRGPWLPCTLRHEGQCVICGELLAPGTEAYVDDLAGVFCLGCKPGRRRLGELRDWGNRMRHSKGPYKYGKPLL